MEDYLTRKGQGQKGSGQCGEALGLICYDGGQTTGPCIGVGFLKLVELCKGLVVLPCLASLVEVYGARTTPWQMGNMTCG